MQQARTLVISDNKPKGDQQKPFTILNTNDVDGQTLLICKYSLFNLQIRIRRTPAIFTNVVRFIQSKLI